MMFTTQMIQLFAIVLGKDSQRVTESLLRGGVMQFINTSEIEGGKLDNLSTVKAEVSLTEISDLREWIEGLLHTSGIILSAPKETDLNNRIPVDIEKERNHLGKIDGQRKSIRERQRVIQQEILKLEDIRRQVELYGMGLPAVTLTAKHSFITIQTGKVPVLKAKRFEDDLRDYPSLNISLGQENDMTHYLLISMKKGQRTD